MLINQEKLQKERPDLIKEIEKWSEDVPIGIRLRGVLDGEISKALHSLELSSYDERNLLIDKIEERLKENDWISLSDGTTFEKTFEPGNSHRR